MEIPAALAARIQSTSRATGKNRDLMVAVENGFRADS